jgi:hypothetical protein
MSPSPPALRYSAPPNDIERPWPVVSQVVQHSVRLEVVLPQPHTRTLRRSAMQCCIMATALTVVTAKASAQSPGEHAAPRSIRITSENARFNNYLQDLAGPGAFIGIVGGGLLDQLRHQPQIWNDGQGLAGRIGSKAGKAAVQVSVRHGLAALMHRSTDYQPCECQGFGRRVEHALLETFTDRLADGRRALSVPRIAGAYAGGFAQLAWERTQSPADAALGSTVSLGFTALFNIAREVTGLAR